MLKVFYPEAIPYYSQIKGHWITKIEDRFYDINGEIDKSYAENYFNSEKDEYIICQSAYVPTYSGQSSSYNKYKKSI